MENILMILLLVIVGLIQEERKGCLTALAVVFLIFYTISLFAFQ